MSKYENFITLLDEFSQYQINITFFKLFNFLILPNTSSLKTNPQNITDMLSMIDQISPNIDKHTYMPNSIEVTDTSPRGVPIGFFLVPINFYLNIKIEKLYAKLQENILQRFIAMLGYIKDFTQQKDSIKQRVLNKDPQTQMFLFNENAKVTKEIRQYEADLDRSLRIFEPRAIEALTRYKKGIADGTSLMKIVLEFEEVFKITDVERNIDKFVEICRQELNAVHFNDGKEVIGSFQLFTDQRSQETWFRQNRAPKVLLKTDGLSQVSGNLFLSFYDLCAGLKQLGFEIGVSVPSAAYSPLSLSIKINANSQVYTNESISFVLKILHVIVDKPSEENYNIKRFYAIFAQLRNFDSSLKKENLNALNYLISLFIKTEHLHFARDHIQTLSELEKMDDKWRVFLSLDCVDTAAEAVDKLKTLNAILNNVTGSVQWLVGNLNIQGCSEGPLFYLVRNGKICYVLTDDLDMVIFENILRSDGDLERGLKRGEKPILSVAAITETFSREKAEYLIKFNEILTGYSSVWLPDESTSFPFKKPTLSNTNSGNRLKEAMDMIRCLTPVETTQSSLFKCTYQTVISADVELKRRFEQAGFSEHISEGLSTRLREFKEKYLLENNPMQIKIDRLFENGINEFNGNEAGLDISSEPNEVIKTWNNSKKKTSFSVDSVASNLKHMEADSGVGEAAMVHLNTLLKISTSENNTCKV